MPQAAKAEKPPLAKPKRTLSEDQLAKLKVARERALEVKKAMKEKSDDAKIKHYEEKIMKIKSKNTDETPATEEIDDLKIEDEDFLEDIDPEPEFVVRKAKPKAKNKKPVVIMEESESESEDDSNVIYIKRGRNKKTEKPAFVQPPEPPPPQPQMQQMPPPPMMPPNPFHRYNMHQRYM